MRQSPGLLSFLFEILEFAEGIHCKHASGDGLGIGDTGLKGHDLNMGRCFREHRLAIKTDDQNRYPGENEGIIRLGIGPGWIHQLKMYNRGQQNAPF